MLGRLLWRLAGDSAQIAEIVEAAQTAPGPPIDALLAHRADIYRRASQRFALAGQDDYKHDVILAALRPQLCDVVWKLKHACAVFGVSPMFPNIEYPRTDRLRAMENEATGIRTTRRRSSITSATAVSSPSAPSSTAVSGPGE